jgi:cell division cycle protein 20 (cofactor of APC complex)
MYIYGTLRLTVLNSCWVWTTILSVLWVGHSMATILLWEHIWELHTCGNATAWTEYAHERELSTCSLSWNSHVLSSDCHTGHIILHDVWQRRHIMAELSCHMGQVCGLKWSPNGRLLASDGDDNMLHIWPAASGLGYSHPKPLSSVVFGQA